MEVLIQNEQDLKKHVVTSSTFDFKKVAPYRKRTDRKFIVTMIGLNQYNELVNYTGTEDVVLEVKDLFSEASANYLMYNALPTINTLITNNGTKNTETSQAKDSDWRDVRDLKRSLINTANEAVDLAMEIMESNVSLFPAWRDSEYFTLFNNLVVRHTRLFNQFFNIQNSRKTFLALKPFMLEVEDQYLVSSFGNCVLNFLKEKSDNTIVQTAQEYLQKAVVSFTISKAALTGTFSITDSAFVISTEELSWEKSKLELDEDKLQRLKQDRESAGINYLNKLKVVLSSNPDIFTCYQEPENTNANSRILKLKGSIAL